MLCGRISVRQTSAVCLTTYVYSLRARAVAPTLHLRDELPDERLHDFGHRDFHLRVRRRSIRRLQTRRVDAEYLHHERPKRPTEPAVVLVLLPADYPRDVRQALVPDALHLPGGARPRGFLLQIVQRVQVSNQIVALLPLLHRPRARPAEQPRAPPILARQRQASAVQHQRVIFAAVPCHDAPVDDVPTERVRADDQPDRRRRPPARENRFEPVEETGARRHNRRDDARRQTPRRRRPPRQPRRETGTRRDRRGRARDRVGVRGRGAVATATAGRYEVSKRVLRDEPRERRRHGERRLPAALRERRPQRGFRARSVDGAPLPARAHPRLAVQRAREQQARVAVAELAALAVVAVAVGAGPRGDPRDPPGALVRRQRVGETSRATRAGARFFAVVETVGLEHRRVRAIGQRRRGILRHLARVVR
eukprot:31311-Pelagococcus_subviridis.AAC.15